MLKGVHKLLTESFFFSQVWISLATLVFWINKMRERFSNQDPETDKETELAKLLFVKVWEETRMASLADIWSSNHVIWPTK